MNSLKSWQSECSIRTIIQAPKRTESYGRKIFYAHLAFLTKKKDVFFCDFYRIEFLPFFINYHQRSLIIKIVDIQKAIYVKMLFKIYFLSTVSIRYLFLAQWLPQEISQIDTQSKNV